MQSRISGIVFDRAMFVSLDEGLDGLGWGRVVNQSRRWGLGLEPYGSRLGWVAQVKVREGVKVVLGCGVGCVVLG